MGNSMTKPTEDHFAGRMYAMGSLNGPIETEAGPEMDRAVAEACGMEVRNYESGFYVREDPAGAKFIRFNPSADWNCAMYAAERFGLFTGAFGGMAQILGHDDEQWTVSDWDEPPDPVWGTAKAETGPLAICRAILKLRAGGGR